MTIHNRIANPLYAGLSGLQLPVPKYLFPHPFENASRLTYYSTFFNSIEFNSSFYKIPQPGTVLKWADSVLPDFKFTFKLWKGITHNRGLNFSKEDVSAFFSSINAVGEKKGSLLIQFPPGLSSDYTMQLDMLLMCIQEEDPSHSWKVAVEFRNTSWYCDKTFDVLHKHVAALVIHDIPKSSTPDVHHTSDFMYIRFHGPTGNYRDSYSDAFLEEYAAYVHEWMDEGKTVYVYFNNTMGDAFGNLSSLKDKLHEIEA